MGPVTAFIGLGTNLGDRKQNILRALAALAASRGVQLQRVSTFLETAPVGLKDQPMYLNCVAEIKTTLDPDQLLKTCLAIETRMGRVRTQRWAPRIIDLDILLYGKKAVRRPGLVIPHPEIPYRPFIQAALRELRAHE
jgi:2-amino-4-hydroxy-6-hydroxymethyldihydropteridine diphosphokinase